MGFLRALVAGRLRAGGGFAFGAALGAAGLRRTGPRLREAPTAAPAAAPSGPAITPPATAPVIARTARLTRLARRVEAERDSAGAFDGRFLPLGDFFRIAFI